MRVPADTMIYLVVNATASLHRTLFLDRLFLLRYMYMYNAFLHNFNILYVSHELHPLMPNGFSHYYQLYEAISNLRVVWESVQSQFYSNFNSIFCKQTVHNLIRRRVLRHLIWSYTVCRNLIKWTLGLNGLTVKENYKMYCTIVEKGKIYSFN